MIGRSKINENNNETKIILNILGQYWYQQHNCQPNIVIKFVFHILPTFQLAVYCNKTKTDENNIKYI